MDGISSEPGYNGYVRIGPQRLGIIQTSRDIQTGNMAVYDEGLGKKMELRETYNEIHRLWSKHQATEKMTSGLKMLTNARLNWLSER